MRLWHKDLIEVLPREQLIAQWRELSAIAGAILKNGTPNHILVNKVLDYPFNHFISYAKLVRQEMTKRGYRTMDSVMEKINGLDINYTLVKYDDIYDHWMDVTYLKICYYNLLEKYMCGGIDEQSWNKITNKLSLSNTYV